MSGGNGALALNCCVSRAQRAKDCNPARRSRPTVRDAEFACRPGLAVRSKHVEDADARGAAPHRHMAAPSAPMRKSADPALSCLAEGLTNRPLLAYMER